MVWRKGERRRRKTALKHTRFRAAQRPYRPRGDIDHFPPTAAAVGGMIADVVTPDGVDEGNSTRRS